MTPVRATGTSDSVGVADAGGADGTESWTAATIDGGVGTSASTGGTAGGTGRAGCGAAGDGAAAGGAASDGAGGGAVEAAGDTDTGDGVCARLPLPRRPRFGFSGFVGWSRASSSASDMNASRNSADSGDTAMFGGAIGSGGTNDEAVSAGAVTPVDVVSGVDTTGDGEIASASGTTAVNDAGTRDGAVASPKPPDGLPTGSPAR